LKVVNGTSPTLMTKVECLKVELNSAQIPLEKVWMIKERAIHYNNMYHDAIHNGKCQLAPKIPKVEVSDLIVQGRQAKQVTTDNAVVI